jgi:hypothetical protein
LKDAFPGIAFEVHGTPKDLDGARDLASRENASSSGGRCRLWTLSLTRERRRAPTAV